MVNGIMLMWDGFILAEVFFIALFILGILFWQTWFLVKKTDNKKRIGISYMIISIIMAIIFIYIFLHFIYPIIKNFSYKLMPAGMTYATTN